MIAWFTAGANSFNVNMVISIHDPDKADLSGVTVTIVGGSAPIAVPPELVQNLRDMVGYNMALVARPPVRSDAPAPPPPPLQ
jgi:hypothetical protein